MLWDVRSRQSVWRYRITCLPSDSSCSDAAILDEPNKMQHCLRTRYVDAQFARPGDHLAVDSLDPGFAPGQHILQHRRSVFAMIRERMLDSLDNVSRVDRHTARLSHTRDFFDNSDCESLPIDICKFANRAVYVTESKAGVFDTLDLPGLVGRRALTAFRRHQGILPSPATKLLDELRRMTEAGL